MTILIAQNQAISHPAVSVSLLNEGYRVITGKGFSEAMQMVEDQHPDLIITDLSTSSSAFKLICAIRQKEDTANTPIMVLSEAGQENLVEKAFELGASDYLSLPNKMNELSIRIHLLAKYKAKTHA